MKPLPTRVLKGITGFFIVLGFGLMLAGPMIARRPATMPRKVYARRAANYVLGFVVSIVGSGIGAFVLVRRARAEYREQSMHNMNDLLEAAREDLLRSKAEPKLKSLEDVDEA